jgi:octaprenyl-diphosphate synthase
MLSKPFLPLSSLSPLEQAHEWLGPCLREVDALLHRMTQSHVALVPVVSGHIIRSGGKRIRPLLTLLACSALHPQGEVTEDAIYFAAAIEAIHTATLLHDDVVDDSQMRRSQPTAKSVWGNKTSILVGDFLLSQALQWMVERGNIHALGILANASKVIAEGEILQLEKLHDVHLSREDYERIIQAKTAELFAASCQLGAIAAGSQMESATVKMMYHYGNDLGCAFQIIDDALDYVAPGTGLGKCRGDDFHEGKVTLPVIYSFAQSIHDKNQEEHNFWRRTIEQMDQQEEDFQQALDYLSKSQAIEFAIKEAKEKANKACLLIKKLPDGPALSLLTQLPLFVVQRTC